MPPYRLYAGYSDTLSIFYGNPQIRLLIFSLKTQVQSSLKSSNKSSSGTSFNITIYIYVDKLIKALAVL